MAGQNLIQKLFGKKDSSLNKAWIDGLMNSYLATISRSIPIVSFDHPHQAIYEAYCKSDILYSIINHKAIAAGRAPWGVYKIKSLRAKKELDDYRLRKDASLTKILELKADAIEPTGHILNEKFANPNDQMSEAEYIESLITFLNATGNCYEYLLKEGSSVLQMHPLGADLVDILPDNNFPMGAAGYKYRLGTPKVLDLDEVIHAKYGNPRHTIDGKQLYGMSPIEVLWTLLRGDDEGANMLAEGRKNRGPKKIVGIDNDKIAGELEGTKMMEGLKAAFRERLRDNKDKIMPIWGRVQTFDMNAMGEASELTASNTNFFQRACGVLNVPHQWVLSLQSESKYNNQSQYDKQAIINGVFPDLNKIRGARNRKFKKLGTIRESQVIDYDETVYSELEVDRVQMMKWLKDAPLTPDQKLIYLGEQASNKPGMDEVLVPGTLVPISQINKKYEQAGQADAGADQETGGEGQGESGGGN